MAGMIKGNAFYENLLYRVWFRLDRSRGHVISGARRESFLLSVKLCATGTSKFTDEICWRKDGEEIPAFAQMLKEIYFLGLNIILPSLLKKKYF